MGSFVEDVAELFSVFLHILVHWDIHVYILNVISLNIIFCIQIDYKYW